MDPRLVAMGISETRDGRRATATTSAERGRAANEMTRSGGAEMLAMNPFGSTRETPAQAENDTKQGREPRNLIRQHSGPVDERQELG